MQEGNKTDLFENPNEGQENLLNKSNENDATKINLSSSLIDS